MEKQMEKSKWGQIKVQEDYLAEARNANRNFALTPFALSPAITSSNA
jgi:hypothetical protein